MDTLGMKYLATIIGFTIANFIWQYFTTKDYSIAFERSYFQSVAIFAFWMINHWD